MGTIKKEISTWESERLEELLGKINKLIQEQSKHVLLFKESLNANRGGPSAFDEKVKELINLRDSIRKRLKKYY